MTTSVAKPPRGKRMAVRPLAFDPFEGKPMEFKHIPQQGCHIARNKQWMFGPFKTLGDLLVAFSTRDGVAPAFTPKQAEKMDRATTPPPVKTRVSASRPLTQCPFTGKKVAIVLSDPENPASSWVIKGEHYRIGGFPTERHAQKFFSTREGVTPNFRALVTEVVNREKPESVDEAFEGLGLDKLREASATLTETGLAGAPKEE